MKLVLDTKVLVAALVADGLCRDLVRRRVRDHELCTSAPLLKELTATLRRKFGVKAAEIPLLEEYRRRTTLVEPVTLPAPVSRETKMGSGFKFFGKVILGSNRRVNIKT